MSWSLPHPHPHQVQDVVLGRGEEQGELKRRGQGCSEGATAESGAAAPLGLLYKGYKWRPAAWGRWSWTLAGVPEGCGHVCSRVESLPWVELVQIVYVRLSGVGGGKRSGPQARFGETALVTFTRPPRY